jgi:hypothetical protein
MSARPAIRCAGDSALMELGTEADLWFEKP